MTDFRQQLKTCELEKRPALCEGCDLWRPKAQAGVAVLKEGGSQSAVLGPHNFASSWHLAPKKLHFLPRVWLGHLGNRSCQGRNKLLALRWVSGIAKCGCGRSIRDNYKFHLTLSFAPDVELQQASDLFANWEYIQAGTEMFAWLLGVFLNLLFAFKVEETKGYTWENGWGWGVCVCKINLFASGVLKGILVCFLPAVSPL